jgi:nitrite reductase/ring-hydroxylating ferredoxin subunit/uncharacterized membrane protein
VILKDLLQGKPLGHPLHPLLAHFPVALFVTSLLFDLSQLFNTGETAVRGAFYTMLVGLIMALLAAIPGLVDWLDIRADHPAKQPATLHMWLNLTLVAIYAINLVLRLSALDVTPTPIIPVLLSVIGVGILSASGYLGGKIVYEDGIAVGRHKRKAPSPDATLRLTEKNGAKPGQYVEVTGADKLAEGETMRLELLGHVIVVARWDGDFYAFQEFCTHRFGPLSEGSFEDCQVRCPWHGSRFDVKTGKVTQGPAKLDINTYEVRVRQGKVEVRAPNTPAPGEESE